MEYLKYAGKKNLPLDNCWFRSYRQRMVINNQNPYIAGQRWISISEPELGLGLVIQVDARHVQLLFPGSADTRTYAIESAPLKRVHFSPGDIVRGHEGEEFEVISVQEDSGLFTYVGESLSLKEAELCDSLSFDDPESRLLSGHVDKTELFELRAETLRHRNNLQTSPVRGFTGARIELLPHQLYVANEVSRRQLPRVLLADEVGLGKTIEACLILHRMIVCGLVKRALVLVPDALVHQWFVELLRRFNLTFAIVDEDHFQEEQLLADHDPFADDQLVLCGIDSLAADRRMAKQALSADWDILIVDEAHHLRWSEEEVSPEYMLVEAFASAVPSLVLLTASPEQAGEEGHFARLRLLDPARYPDFKQFMAEHEKYEAVAEKAEELISGSTEEELQDLLDRHGPGRVMFRNSRAAMPAFPSRIPHMICLEAMDDETDPRIEWLASFLKADPDLKVFVICKCAEDALFLHEKLHVLIAADIAMFHESMPLLQCDRQAAWFAEPDGARVLISSGIGGEGRNFQFVNHMVLMDVPEDPESVEQRIGRLDRIGQHRDIHIHVPYIKGSREEGLVRWLNKGLDAFETPVVGGYRMYLEFRDRLGDVTDELIAETRKVHKSLCREIAKGRDRLLELNSCRPAIADGLVQMVQEADDDETLENYMAVVFEQFGVGVEVLREHDYLLRPDLLYSEEFPMPRDSMRITYDRRHALERPIITLLSWDHPMVHGAMDLILGSDKGSCAVSRAVDNEAKILQAVFVLETVSVHNAAVNRFMPLTPITVCVDDKFSLLDKIPQAEGDGDSWVIHEDLEFRNEVFPEMMAVAKKKAAEQAGKIKHNALKSMQSEMSSELQRLKDLRAKNDNIRDEEVDALETQADEFSAAISNARIRLDSLRLIMPPQL